MQQRCSIYYEALTLRAVITICHSCFFEPKNGPAIEYYSTGGADVRYVLSTLVNFEAEFEYTGTVTVVSSDDLKANVLDIHFLTDRLTEGCVVRSMEYDDNRMFEIPSEYSFFGPLTTSRRNS